MDKNDLEAALSGLDMLDGDLDMSGDLEESVSAGASSDTIGMFKNVPLTVTLEVASVEVTMGELSLVNIGDILPLDKAVNEPLDVKVNGIPFAKAEVVSVDGNYAVKFVSRTSGTESASADND